MTEAANSQVKIETAAITDRGLSEKRPLNEDSFYSDPERHIFAVADGVGGANAGEVASQTAIEVLSEAFRHNLEDADIEDLMELAIQRANASIHQMSREQPKFSMMATTVVALHLDGYRATIGHVGDSRLYRLTPDGELRRETEDHSVVEEEVRAGRMTPAQAATHPSRNVISRALGAEDGVEVDMKTIEVEDGTTFLLCSDGITRHIPDEEIRELLARGGSLREVCAEMKRRCYERGAEDNLTALLVRVGASSTSGDGDNAADFDEEGTLIASPVLAATLSGANDGNAAPALSAQQQHSAASSTSSLPASSSTVAAGADGPAGADAVAATTRGGPSTPAHGIDRLAQANALNAQAGAATAVSPAPQQAAVADRAPAPVKTGSGIARTLLRLLIFLIGITVAGGLAFYAGKAYQRQLDLQKAASATIVPDPTPTPEDPAALFEKQRRAVDRDPRGSVERMSVQNQGKPLDSTDPEFLYLYGRALMLSGKHQEANEAFLKSLDQLKERPAHDPVRIEAQISSIAAAFKANNAVALRTAAAELDKLIQTEEATGSASPLDGNGNSSGSNSGSNNSINSAANSNIIGPTQ